MSNEFNKNNTNKMNENLQIQMNETKQIQKKFTIISDTIYSLQSKKILINRILHEYHEILNGQNDIYQSTNVPLTIVMPVKMLHKYLISLHNMMEICETEYENKNEYKCNINELKHMIEIFDNLIGSYSHKNLIEKYVEYVYGLNNRCIINYLVIYHKEE